MIYDGVERVSSPALGINALEPGAVHIKKLCSLWRVGYQIRNPMARNPKSEIDHPRTTSAFRFGRRSLFSHGPLCGHFFPSNGTTQVTTVPWLPAPLISNEPPTRLAR